MSAARRWRAARDGSILPLIALVVAVLLGAVAFAVDYGSLHHEKRRLQGAADLAAIVAAQTPLDAERLARLSLADNGVPAPAGLAIRPGRYGADRALGPAARFHPGEVPANAVHVAFRQTAPLVFARALTGQTGMEVSASALAAQSRLASIAIGSRLLSVKAGVLNAVLGAMLGAELSLTVVDYEALLGAKVDAFSFADGLATRLNLQAATYSDVLSGEASIVDVVAATVAAAQAGGASPAAIAALQKVSGALRGAAARVPLARLVDLDEVGRGLAASGAAHPAAPMGAFEWLAAAAQVANGDRQVAVDLAPALAGVLEARLRLVVGERPQAAVSFGPLGSTVRTAQVRLLLEARLPAPAGLAEIRLPVYAELGSGEATLSALACPWSSGEQRSATVRARSGAVDAALADIGAAPFGSARPDLGRSATLLAAPAITVRGHARVSLASPVPRDLLFSQSDIAGQRARTVTSTGLVGALVASLVAGSTLDVSVAGIGLGLPLSGTVRSTVGSALTAAAPGLDGALDAVLHLLGIGIGQADVWVRSVHCGRAVLVQ